jgi:hypothetical protein
MYGEANHCYFRNTDGTQDLFLQHEGFPQGNSLATILSCMVLVLHLLLKQLKQLNNRLHLHALHHLHSRNASDGGQGSQSATHSFINDTFTFLPCEDLLTFIHDFKGSPHFHPGFQRTAPLGIKLNCTKTKILITTSTQPLHSLVSPAQLTRLHLALAELDGPKSEITQGTHFLGAPLGSSNFVNQSLFSRGRQRFRHILTHQHTTATLFKFCSLPSLSHLLVTDVLHNYYDLSTLPSLTAWHAPFTSSILTTSTSTLLKHLGDTNDDL